MLTNIAIEKLHPHPDNPRKDLKDIPELAENIKAHGILQNLTVVPRESGYTVIIGHRRLAAAKLAGLTEVLCSVVEMDERTQVATMLAENIQRSDLTAHEQARGFQMMLDLGDSVADVAKRTGFSAATVRKYVNLMELNQDKFAKYAAERQASLADYVALLKIEGPKRRDKVLDNIGTHNFKWELESALRDEKRAKNRKIVVAELKKFAAKIKQDKTAGYQYVAYIDYDKTKFNVPDDAGETKYYFTEDAYGCMLYKDKQKQEKPQKTPEELEREVRQKRLKGLYKQAYESRLEFARDFRAKGKVSAVIEKQALKVFVIERKSADPDTFRALFGIDKKFRLSWESADKGETYAEAAARVFAEHSGTSNATLMFWGTYCAMEKNGNCCDYTGLRFSRNAELVELYGYLMALGYALSDEEKALLDGTHELYDAPEPDDDEEDGDGD